jgi:hypothetical protein
MSQDAMAQVSSAISSATGNTISLSGEVLFLILLFSAFFGFGLWFGRTRLVALWLSLLSAYAITQFALMEYGDSFFLPGEEGAASVEIASWTLGAYLVLTMLAYLTLMRVFIPVEDYGGMVSWIKTGALAFAFSGMILVIVSALGLEDAIGLGPITEKLFSLAYSRIALLMLPFVVLFFVRR